MTCNDIRMYETDILEVIRPTDIGLMLQQLSNLGVAVTMPDNWNDAYYFQVVRGKLQIYEGSGLMPNLSLTEWLNRFDIFQYGQSVIAAGYKQPRIYIAPNTIVYMGDEANFTCGKYFRTSQVDSIQSPYEKWTPVPEKPTFRFHSDIDLMKHLLDNEGKHYKVVGKDWKVIYYDGHLEDKRLNPFRVVGADGVILILCYLIDLYLDVDLEEVD